MSIKKILLVHDTRGAHEYLYRAFNQMGIECDMALFGWPTINNISRSYNFDPLRKFGVVGKVFRPLINLYNLHKMEEYDVASFVHRISFIDKPHFLRYRDLPILRDKVNVMSYTGLGCDELSFIAGNGGLPYSPCDSCQKYDDMVSYCPRKVRPLQTRASKALNKYFDSVYSIGVEYSHLASLYKKEVYPMPLPVDISEIPWMPTRNISRKVNIVHTPSRSGFKGSAQVLKAIEILKSKTNDFTFNIVSGLSFDEYIKVIGNADVIIDQVWSQSPGMNALWLLGMGKIVLSGNTEVAKNYINEYQGSPVIDASPVPEILANSLHELILDKSRFNDISERGIQYLKENHDHKLIAKRYLDSWAEI
ncbi:glycosyltransferase [Aeromonas veronii]|uniref:glycosyltransferase n=1 Tax=Aeromonas veronii TaxID=654 RepID=UPI001882D60D|nr:glycosyltransferase [Aeromonas veronii]MBE8735444.1 glycosyltransferase [Aeromonas veronii]MBE8740106.1 glycosyltransferase [Aeromonas veronii]MBE8742868.1 glycosyltransferase [Aeromonas veronii]MBE8762795.1 glycosyltransferase [Aeromonas veronii]MBE8838417.1 glycosyltransferase [Aeromonas veronii]